MYGKVGITWFLMIEAMYLQFFQLKFSTINFLKDFIRQNKSDLKNKETENRQKKDY